jgi:hypothetical protein
MAMAEIAANMVSPLMMVWFSLKGMFHSRLQIKKSQSRMCDSDFDDYSSIYIVSAIFFAI